MPHLDKYECWKFGRLHVCKTQAATLRDGTKWLCLPVFSVLSDGFALCLQWIFFLGAALLEAQVSLSLWPKLSVSPAYAV